MPVMNGMDTIALLRKEPLLKDLKIYALSADAFIEQQQAAIKAGFNPQTPQSDSRVEHRTACGRDKSRITRLCAVG